MPNNKDLELWKKLYQQQLESNRQLINPSEGSSIIKRPPEEPEEEPSLEQPLIDPIDLAVPAGMGLASKGSDIVKQLVRQAALRKLQAQEGGLMGQKLETFTKELNPDLYKFQTIKNIKKEDLSPEFLENMQRMEDASKEVSKYEIGTGNIQDAIEAARLKSLEEEKTIKMLFPNVFESLQKTKKIGK